MLLRREVHLILWVSALALVVAMIFRATLPPITESGSEANLLDTATQVRSDNDGKASGTAVWRRQLIEVPDTARALFPAASEPVEEPVQQVVPTHAIPVLKGVIQSGSELRAVFVDPNGGDYRTLGAGDTVGDYEIVAVEADQVSMRSPQGDEIFHLRGPGEHP